jgi:hypothetical protein
MNVFEAIPITVFVASAVAGGRLADTLIPESDSSFRFVAVLLAALVCGYGAVKLYLAFLNIRAKADVPKKHRKTNK